MMKCNIQQNSIIKIAYSLKTNKFPLSLTLVYQDSVTQNVSMSPLPLTTIVPRDRIPIS